MLNILIAEGTPAVWQAERAGFGLPSNFSLLAAAVRLHCPEIRCTQLNIADSKPLPFGITLSDFDGVMFPGSPLHIYDPDPCITRQIDFARAAFGAGVPVWVAAGVCSLPWWRSGDRSGATRGAASCRSLEQLP
jgi:GMP synthase (glutamine-hydrolysing)